MSPGFHLSSEQLQPNRRERAAHPGTARQQSPASNTSTSGYKFFPHAYVDMISSHMTRLRGVSTGRVEHIQKVQDVALRSV